MRGNGTVFISKGNDVAHGGCWAFISTTGCGETDWGIKKEWQSTF